MGGAVCVDGVWEIWVAVSDAMGPRVMVLEPFTTHSKLLLSAQGVELEVDICGYFNDAL